jgi:hypothetical protein
MHVCAQQSRSSTTARYQEELDVVAAGALGPNPYPMHTTAKVVTSLALGDYAAV